MHSGPINPGYVARDSLTRKRPQSVLGLNDLLKKSFDEFRAQYPARECPDDRIDNLDQLKQMEVDHGLSCLADGSDDAVKGEVPEIESSDNGIHLWVVMPSSVVHAPEMNEFGSTLESGIIKHTNLSGGEPAHSGGQLVVLSENTLVIDGGSGRYGPQSDEEMTAVAKAFRNSGYGVWSYGYDEESGWPFRIGSKKPEWIE